jgi:hypothetical protein
LRQVQPIPDWFRSSWSIKLPNGNVTIIQPKQKEWKTENDVNVQNTMATEVLDPKGSEGTMMGTNDKIDGSEGIDDDVDDCDFVITARQFEKVVEETANRRVFSGLSKGIT